MTCTGSPGDPTVADQPPFDFTDPVACLTNLPGLLGHYPSRTFVLMVRREGAPDPGPLLVRELDDAVGALAALGTAAPMMAEEGNDCADVLVVHESWPGCVGGRAPDGRELADVLMAGGLHPMNYAGARAIRPGTPVSLWTGEEIGRIGDPVASWAAVKLHDSGEAIAAGVDEHRGRFAVRDADVDGRAAAALRKAAGEVRGLRKGVGAIPGGVTGVRRFHEEWERLLADVDEGRVRLDDAMAEPAHLLVLARPLVSLLLRDMTMTAIGGDHADTVRVIWLRCAQLFRGTARANALACYAIDRFAHGSPATADAALAAALETDPGHSLTQLLRAAMMSGGGRTAVEAMLDAAEGVRRAVHGDGEGDCDGD